jgi:hypothetical protein
LGGVGLAPLLAPVPARRLGSSALAGLRAAGAFLKLRFYLLEKAML